MRETSSAGAPALDVSSWFALRVWSRRQYCTRHCIVVTSVSGALSLRLGAAQFSSHPGRFPVGTLSVEPQDGRAWQGECQANGMREKDRRYPGRSLSADAARCPHASCRQQALSADRRSLLPYESRIDPFRFQPCHALDFDYVEPAYAGASSMRDRSRDGPRCKRAYIRNSPRFHLGRARP